MRMAKVSCWNCENGYADKCAWIGEGKKIWTKAKKSKRVKVKNYRKTIPEYGEYTVYMVEECKYFKPEGKRKVYAS